MPKNIRRKNGTWYIWGFIAIVVAVFIYIIYQGSAGNSGKPGQHDAFAQCIANKNIVMYGAYWCPHCQQVKADFGSSFQFMKYVECTENTQLCLEKGVNGYPTFIFPDGRKIEGYENLDALSQQTGCPLSK